MLLGVKIMSPGETMVVIAIGVAMIAHFAKKYLNDNPDVKDVAKKAAAQKAISLIARWLK